MTDHVTEDYVRECLSEGSRLRDVVRQVSYPPKYLECFGQRLMHRPFFIAESETRRAAEDLTTVFDVLTSLPDRLFDGDVARYCAELGFDERQTALMTRLGGARPAVFGRSDLYHDGNSLKMLEFNVGSQLGGIDQCQVLPALMRVEAFRAFAEEHRLGYVHTGEQIARSLRAVAEPVARGDVPVVAVLEADGAIQPLMPLFASFQEMLGGFGLDVRLGEVSQVRCRNGKLFLDGTPIDAVLRYFTVNEICQDPSGEQAVEPVMQAHEAGGTVLMTTLKSLLFANKGCLALLSDPRWRGAFSREETAVIDRLLPWTRDLADQTVSVDGESVGTMDYCCEQRQRLILKPRNEYGGAGIVLGWETSHADWREALLTCRQHGYVVQERVVQRAEPVVDPDTGERQDWVAAWSTFLTPAGYAGAHIRALPAGHRGVIGRGANAATRVTGVFHHPDVGPNEGIGRA
jgi:hypothetical protein